jgi:hypothetical protein
MFAATHPSSISAVLTMRWFPPCLMGMVQRVQPQSLQNTLCFSWPLVVFFKTTDLLFSVPLTVTLVLSNFAHWKRSYQTVKHTLHSGGARGQTHNLKWSASILPTVVAEALDACFWQTGHLKCHSTAETGSMGGRVLGGQSLGHLCLSLWFRCWYSH